MAQDNSNNTDVMSLTHRELGGESTDSITDTLKNTLNLNETKTHAPSKEDNNHKVWSSEEKKYLLDNWIASGRSAKQVQNTVHLHLGRTIESCKAEYRRLTSGKAAAKKIAKKNTVIETRSVAEYTEDKMIRSMYDNLSPSAKGIIIYMAMLGAVDKIDLDMSNATLIVQFEKKNTLSVETGAGNRDIEI